MCDTHLTHGVFLKELKKKNDFEKNQQTTKNMQNYPVGKELSNTMQMQLLPLSHGLANIRLLNINHLQDNYTIKSSACVI